MSDLKTQDSDDIIGITQGNNTQDNLGIARENFNIHPDIKAEGSLKPEQDAQSNTEPVIPSGKIDRQGGESNTNSSRIGTDQQKKEEAVDKPSRNIASSPKNLANNTQQPTAIKQQNVGDNISNENTTAASNQEEQNQEQSSGEDENNNQETNYTDEDEDKQEEGNQEEGNNEEKDNEEDNEEGKEEGEKEEEEEENPQEENTSEDANNSNEGEKENTPGDESNKAGKAGVANDKTDSGIEESKSSIGDATSNRGKDFAQQIGGKIGRNVGEKTAETLGTDEDTQEKAGNIGEKGGSLAGGYIYDKYIAAGSNIAANGVGGEAAAGAVTIEAAGGTAAVEGGGIIAAIGGWPVVLIILAIILVVIIILIIVAVVAPKLSFDRSSPANQQTVASIENFANSSKIVFANPTADLNKIKSGEIAQPALNTINNLAKSHEQIFIHYTGNRTVSPGKIAENDSFEFDITAVDKIKCTDTASNTKIVEFPIYLNLNYNWQALVPSSYSDKVICAVGYYPQIDPPVKSNYDDLFSPGEFPIQQLPEKAKMATQMKSAEVIDEIISQDKLTGTDSKSDESLLPVHITIDQRLLENNFKHQTNVALQSVLAEKINQAYKDDNSPTYSLFIPAANYNGLHIQYL